MTDADFATCTKIAEIVTKRYSRTYSWVPRSDLQQEAWVAMLEALPRYDSSRSTLDGFLYVTANTALMHLTWSATAAVHIPRNIRNKHTISAGKGVTADGVLESQVSQQASVTDQYEEQELRQVVAQVVAEHLADGREGEVMAAVLSGELTTAQGAEALGIQRNNLYQRLFQLRRCMASDSRLQEVR